MKKSKPQSKNSIELDYIPIPKNNTKFPSEDEVNARFARYEGILFYVVVVIVVALIAVIIAVIGIVLDQLHFNNSVFQEEKAYIDERWSNLEIRVDDLEHKK